MRTDDIDAGLSHDRAGSRSETSESTSAGCWSGQRSTASQDLSSAILSFRIRYSTCGTDDLEALAISVAECEEAVQSHEAKDGRHRLLRSDSAGNRRSSQDDRGEETQLHPIRFSILDSGPSQTVCMLVQSLYVSTENQGNASYTGAQPCSRQPPRESNGF